MDLKLFRRLFVSREDVYAIATEKKPGYRLARKPLDDAALEAHLAGKFSIGCYAVLPEENTARWICFDIDDDRKSAVERIARQSAYFLPKDSVVVEKTGGRGWHVWLLFDSWISAIKLREFGNRIIRDANPGLKIEIFPKGTEVEVTGFGTLVRLPLGKHPRTGEGGALYSVEMKPTKLEDIQLASEDCLPEIILEAKDGSKGLIRKFRKWPCIATLEAGVPEGYRDEALFALACHYRDQGLSQQVAGLAVEEANLKNLPPLKSSLVAEKVESAYKDKAKIGCSTPVLEAFCKKNICWLHRSMPGERERRSWKVGDLLEADLPPMNWIVKDMLPQGFALLSGKPKIGKSWMALGLGIAVATGREFLGHSTQQGPVLFLALEDGEARIQERLKHFDVPPKTPLQIEFDFSRFGEGGYEDMTELLTKGFEGNPFQLVVIDCLVRAKSTKREELSPEDMEIIVRPLQAWGHAIGACFLVVHHHRKSASGDVIWDPRGSGAIVGVADVAAGIYEDEGAYRFITRSRDAPELSYWVAFEDGIWKRDDDFKLRAGSEIEKVALTEIAEHGQVQVEDVAGLADCSLPAARSALSKLVRLGILECDRGSRPFIFRRRPEQIKMDLDKEIEL